MSTLCSEQAQQIWELTTPGLNDALGTDVPPTYVFEGIDKVAKLWSELQLVSKYLDKSE